MKEDADVKEILASLYREQKIKKNRESLLLQIKEAWQEDPDFREQLREFVKTQPSSDVPGRKPKIDTEKVQSLLRLASKIGIKKNKYLVFEIFLRAGIVGFTIIRTNTGSGSY